MKQTSERTAVKASLLRKAAKNPALRDRVRKAGLVPQRRMNAAQRADLVDAIRIARGESTPPEFMFFTKPVPELKLSASKLPSIDITKMPGFSPMQLRQQINRISEIRREVEIITAQFEAELGKVKKLEKEEKDGLAALSKAARSMSDKANYCADAEKALLTFTVYMQEKRPGIEQMVARPEDSKWGAKAGDLFGRIAAKLGSEIAASVETMYRECEEDLSHTAQALKGLKVVTKTSGLKHASLKTAGPLADVVVGIKEWLAGAKSSIAQRILGFAGTIMSWVKGFAERTKIVGKAEKDLETALKNAKAQTDKLLAGAF